MDVFLFVLLMCVIFPINVVEPVLVVNYHMFAIIMVAAVYHSAKIETESSYVALMDAVERVHVPREQHAVPIIYV